MVILINLKKYWKDKEMKAVIYKGINDFNVIDNIEEPNINKLLNVKIKVRYCGICGSDIHKLLFEKPNQNYVKTKILGHEVTGIVVDTMKGVKNVKIGDRVVIEPLLYCNKCNMCRNGYIQFCDELKSLGKEFAGGFAEYIVVNEKQLYKIDDNTSMKVATLTDPYSVAMHINNLIKNSRNSKIAIIGDGIIGLACAELLSSKNEVIVFGKHNNRFDILKEINVKYLSLEEIHKYLNYFDIVIEAVGGRQNSTLKNAIDISQKKGKILIAGVYDNNFTFNVSLRNAFYKELNIIGCNSFEKENDISEFKLALDFLSNKSKIANKLIGKEFKISEFNEAIEYIKNRKENNCIKIMIKM